ncbi:alanine dehydrogenase [Neomoorella humiferrea]|uniref:Alanine dehydrogenase n=1 Tax=Neomoorella humiferrea TaxID=676965 RepID=A0A2T0AYT7_9FIRM|nr:alanine dehydrogenase [Moorella humiferrea]PRR76166.1 Alanine dehydrogenase [Moorella humiferrea]
MIIGVPKEIKDKEGRVSLTPAGCKMLVKMGHKVIVEAGAGNISGFSDAEYQAAGAIMEESPAKIFSEADLILKVKEPLPPEYSLLKEGQVLFTYLHLAADKELTEVLLKKKIVGIAYETVELKDGSLPLLKPMSEIAGKMSVQIGARLLEKPFGGKGVLLGGVPGVAPGVVVIVGAGVVGTSAAKIAVGLGAEVYVLDINAERLRYLDDIFGGRVKTLISNEYNLEYAISKADLLIGGVLVPGYKAPRIVTEEMIKKMAPGSVVIDVAIDQGGCIETVDRVTTHSNPTFEKFGVIHYSVANIPGSVPRTSTLALTSATLPYLLEIVNKGWERAIRENQYLAKGVNTFDGKLTNKGVAEAHDMPYYPLVL